MLKYKAGAPPQKNRRSRFAISTVFSIPFPHFFFIVCGKGGKKERACTFAQARFAF
jgi:hypothetical protein